MENANHKQGASSLRFMLCAIPAADAAVVFGLLHWSLGLVAFACMFGFGWDVTTARRAREVGNG